MTHLFTPSADQEVRPGDVAITTERRMSNRIGG
jgi:hypothetical protein